MDSCPKCEENPVMKGDYLCGPCRGLPLPAIKEVLEGWKKAGPVNGHRDGYKCQECREPIMNGKHYYADDTRLVCRECASTLDPVLDKAESEAPF